MEGDICLSFMTGRDLNLFIACIVSDAPSVSIRDSVVTLHSRVFATDVTSEDSSLAGI